MARPAVRRRSNDGEPLPIRRSLSDAKALDRQARNGPVLQTLRVNQLNAPRLQRSRSNDCNLAGDEPSLRLRRVRQPTVEVLVDVVPTVKKRRRLAAANGDATDADVHDTDALDDLDRLRMLADNDEPPSTRSQLSQDDSAAGDPPPRRRPHARTASLPSLSALTLNETVPSATVTQHRAVSDVAPGHLRRSSRIGGHGGDTLEQIYEVSEMDSREVTPIAHRTRRRSSNQSRAVHTSTARDTDGESTIDESEDELASDDESEFETADASCETVVAVRSRRLRDRKLVAADDDEDNSDDDWLSSPRSGSSADVIDGDAGAFTPNGLLRRRRDELADLCRQRRLAADGTKRDMVHILMAWRESGPGSAGDVDGSSRATSPSSSASSALTSPCHARDAPSTRLSGRPRLLQSRHNPFSDKPATPEPESDEETATLDLDSLGLVDKAIAPDRIKRGDKIGSGGFKDVYIGRYRNYKVAIADLRGHLTENDIKELSLLRDLQHPNIVRFIGVSVPDEPRAPSAPSCTLVTEICLNGDLFDYLRSGAAAPSLRRILQMMLDITLGLEFLHTRTPRIIHRDMKSSNVLITAKGVAKINDFGLARVKTSTRSVVKSLVGTVNWQAPELWAAKPKYNEKVDVYATGLVFWEMLQFHLPVKRYPFEGSNEHAIYHDVGQLGLRPPTATMGRRWGADILELVNRMWAQLATDRPSMSEVREALETMLETALA